MIRIAIGVLGVVTTLFPGQIIDVFETLAIENPDEITPRSWLPKAIRSEGMIVAVASLLGGRLYAWIMTLTGGFGAIVLLFPGLYREIAMRFVYEQPNRVVWNERFTISVRLIGVLYVLLAVRAFSKRRTDK